MSISVVMIQIHNLVDRKEIVQQNFQTRLKVKNNGSCTEKLVEFLIAAALRKMKRFGTYNVEILYKMM